MTRLLALAWRLLERRDGGTALRPVVVVAVALLYSLA
jgi:hypothetical protein